MALLRPRRDKMNNSNVPHTLAGGLGGLSLLLSGLLIVVLPRTATKASDYSASSSIADAEKNEPTYDDSLKSLPSWIDSVKIGYQNGFMIVSEAGTKIDSDQSPFVLRLNGLGQLRHTVFESQTADEDLNQFQLKRGRLIFSGNAFSSNLRYFVQLDGRSTAGEEFRLLDYFMEFDLGNQWLDFERNAIVFKAGRFKIPFTFARDLSAREFQFADRSVASMFFDLNRSLGWSLGGQTELGNVPVKWETSLFNGFVTGGAETGSTGALDDNFAYSMHLFAFPIGDWGSGALSDFDWHDSLATRVGIGYAGTNLDRDGPTEFDIIRVVDSGGRLSNILPLTVDEYSVNTYCVNGSCKYRGLSATIEYYFRNIGQFRGADLPDLFDHGFWLQVGKFVIPQKLELISRWSRVVGSSGTLGDDPESADEVAGGFVMYFKGQNAKVTCDATWINGAPINATALDITPGADGWLARTQIQFAF